jgi:hypothetical protein
MQSTYRQETDKIPNTKETFTPTLMAQIKLHKPDKPIRPIINNMNAPTYKVAKYLLEILNKRLSLRKPIQYYKFNKLSHKSNKIKTKQKPPTDNV